MPLFARAVEDLPRPTQDIAARRQPRRGTSGGRQPGRRLAAVAEVGGEYPASTQRVLG